MKKLALTIANKNIAFKVFMPFVEDGAAFVPTEEVCGLGEAITLTINMPELQKEITCPGAVVWVSPAGAHTKQGVGVQFQGKEGDQMKQALETYIVGMKDEGKKTFTL